MDISIPQNLTQCTFDFDVLNDQPVEDLILRVSPVPPKATSVPQRQKPRSDFFCYRLIRSDTGLPFYIGKGCGKRDETHEMNARNHRKDCSHRVCNTIRKLWREGHRVIRERVAEDITETSAFALEKLFVSLGAVYGWDLCNHTNGGEGVSGYRWTEEQRKMRQEVVRREMALHPDRFARFQEGRINRKVTAEEIQKRNRSVAIAWSDPARKQARSETSKKMWQDEEFRAKQMSRFEDPEIRKKMGDHGRGKANNALAKTYPGFVGPDDTIYENVFNISAFCREHGLQVSSMCNVASGEAYHHKGWRAYPLREEPAKKPPTPKNPYTGFVSPHDGQVYHVTSTLKDFCKEHGLTLGAMSNVNAGKWPSHKGWIKYIP